jgi:hypothetical protein
MAKRHPGAIHLRMIEVMKRFPEGVSIGQIRHELGLRPDEHAHLDKRKRDLKQWFVIEKRRTTVLINGKKQPLHLYKYVGDKSESKDEGAVSEKLRAEVIHAAHQRCQMCGETVDRHGISLVVDHKKPRDWGGTNDRDNLWAICERCNGGKKAYFSSLHMDPAIMKRITAFESIHVRIGETLKAVGVGKRIPPALLEVVANQEDWQKRLRELRYPVIGWKIDPVPYKTESGKKKVDYVLRKHEPWPDDPTGKIRRYEQARKRRNRGEVN